MGEKVGIRFKACGKLYYFEVNGTDIGRGDRVVVESSFGMTIGRVVTERLPAEEGGRELKKIVRKATDEDMEHQRDNKTLEQDAGAYCLERVHARGLPMKLVCTEMTLDKKRIIFYFTADGRIDFRELVKDLAAKFKTRIEMRQIGVRDETKLLGGIGICGREVCCRTFLTSFAPISIRMAKKQELVLNASKLSGLCGRLMCCLNYEYAVGDRGKAGSGDEPVLTEENEDIRREYASLDEFGDAAAIEQEKIEPLGTPKKHAEGVGNGVSASDVTGRPLDDGRIEPSGGSQYPKGKKPDGKGKRRSRKFLRRRKKRKNRN